MDGDWNPHYSYYTDQSSSQYAQTPRLGSSRNEADYYPHSGAQTSRAHGHSYTEMQHYQQFHRGNHPVHPHEQLGGQYFPYSNHHNAFYGGENLSGQVYPSYSLNEPFNDLTLSLGSSSHYPVQHDDAPTLPSQQQHDHQTDDGVQGDAEQDEEEHEADDDDGSATPWSLTPSPNQIALVELIYEYSGYDRDTIRDRCKNRMTDEILSALSSGREMLYTWAVKELFPLMKKVPRKQLWMVNMTDDQVREVIEGTAQAAGRRTVFITNAFARLKLDDSVAFQLLYATPEQRHAIATELGLTKEADQAAAAAVARSTRSTKGKGQEPWMLDTSADQRILIVKKLAGIAKKSEAWCYGKLRLSESRGLGKRIARASDRKTLQIAHWLDLLKPGQPFPDPPWEK
ncbi:hypothetical protein CBS101457_000299 [Exobasidium rhododendri]|nr:hypothetical protein CBS101457_000299 [Exobasidium rhododendri]